jgi:hypothetical protein
MLFRWPRSSNLIGSWKGAIWGIHPMSRKLTSRTVVGMKTNPTYEWDERVSTIHQVKCSASGVRICLGLWVVMTSIGCLTGCVGYADGGYGGYGDYGGYDDGPGPDLYLFGGDYGRGRDVHSFSHRGSMSRSMAHAGGGGHFGGSRGGGGHGGEHSGEGRR